MPEYADSLFPIVQFTWETLLQLPVDEQGGEQTDTSTNAWAGVITIGGAWEGAVAVQLPESLGRQAACILFSTAETAVTSQDVQDALAELTNVVGGNLKAILPPPCKLGLPVVLEGDDYRIWLPKDVTPISRQFRCEDQLFTVVIAGRAAA